MAVSAYLNDDLSFNLKAIMSAAWASARQAIQPRRPMRGYTPKAPPSLREAFKAALRRIWDLARGHKASRQHFIAAMADAVARQAMTPMEREIAELREARVLAPMTDSTRRMVAELSAIESRAAALGVVL